MPAKPIPEGYHTLNPHLAVDDAAQAIEFYKRAFGAKERERVATPDGKIAHAELEIGDSVLMLADPMSQSPFKSPKQIVAMEVTNNYPGGYWENRRYNWFSGI